MKKYSILILITGAIGIFTVACEKEQPAENIAGSYTGVLSGTYDNDDTLVGNYPVSATTVTTNKVMVTGNLFGSFEVLVSQNGINVIPVSTDDVIFEFLYQGDLKELSFKYYKDGDSTDFVGTKP